MRGGAPGRSGVRARCGLTLVEIIVALVLLAVVLSIGSIAAQRVLVVQSALALTASRSSAIRDALQALHRHLANVEPAAGDLRVARDTLLELVHTIGVVTACRVSRDTLVIASAADSQPWAASLPRAVTADDGVRVWHDAAATWSTHQVVSVASASGVCGDSAWAWPDRASQRLVLADSLAGVVPGAPVRVLQRERWSLLRSGDGSWALSLATWDAVRGAFAVPQPLVSPLSPPGARAGAGFSVRALDAVGRLLTDSALVRASSVMVVMRSARHARQGDFSDSVRIHVGAR